ncbi:Uncharacterised protein [uncultured Blautia sp.]|nr:Uncharacterised protein [uncultured Blautia sp.]
MNPLDAVLVKDDTAIVSKTSILNKEVAPSATAMGVPIRKRTIKMPANNAIIIVFSPPYASDCA